MDPDVCLEMCRRLAESIVSASDLGQVTEEEGQELAETFQNLDTWMSRGGFLPQGMEERMSDWNISTYLYDPETDEQLDYIPGTPGPETYNWLKDLTQTHKKGMSQLNVFLSVIHKPSGYSEKARIYKENKRFSAFYRGELIKLGKAVTLMQGDLWPNA